MPGKTAQEIADSADQIDRELARASGVTATEGRCLAQLIAQLAKIVAQIERRT